MPARLSAPSPQESTQRAIAEQYKLELLGQIQAAREAQRLQRQTALQEGALLRCAPLGWAGPALGRHNRCLWLGTLQPARPLGPRAAVL
jgi:hypothetical protein